MEYKGVTEYIVFLVPKLANRASAADTAVTFVNAKDLPPDELERLHKLNVLIKEKQIPKLPKASRLLIAVNSITLEETLDA